MKKNKKQYIFFFVVVLLLNFLCPNAILTSDFRVYAEDVKVVDNGKLDSSSFVVDTFSEYGSWTKAKMLDGLTGMANRWASGKLQEAGQWIIIDMKEAKEFNKTVMITDVGDGGYAKEYNIYVSQDGKEWGKPISSGAGQDGNTVDVFRTQKARYIKVVLSKSWSAGWWNIYEFNIYNDKSLKLSEPVQIPQDVKGTVYEDAFTFLTTFEIIESSVSEFKPDEQITLLDYAKLMAKISGVSDEEIISRSNDDIFGGTSADEKALNYIRVAIDLQIITGFKDGKFKSNDPVLYEQAIKSFVSLLGYDFIAQKSGDYPFGYLTVANNIKLTKNAIGKIGEPLKRGTFAQLLYNLYNTDIMKQTGFGDKAQFEVQDGVTLLDRQKIYKKSGLVTATETTSLTKSDSGLRTNEVKIDDTIYEVGSTNVASYLGYRVEFYEKEDSSSDDKVLVYVKPMRGKDIELIVNADDIKSETTRYNLVYQDVNQKEKQATISEKAILIYNEKSKLDIANQDLMPDAGSVKLLDSDGDGIYDVIFVKSYINYVVKSVNPEDYIISDKYNQPPLKIGSGSDSIKNKVVSDNGMKLGISNITPGCVLSIAADKEKIVNGSRVIDTDNVTYCTLYVSRNKIEGKVTGISDVDGEQFVVINDIEYKIANNLKNVFPALKLNYEGVLSLDIDGKLASFDDAKYELTYGILLGFAREGNLDKKLKFKIFNSNGSENIYEGVEKISLNGVKLPKEQVYEQVNKYFTENPQLAKVVKYELNEDGEITWINIPQQYPSTGNKDYHDKGRLELSGSRGAKLYRSGPQTFDGNFFFDGTTIVFKMKVLSDGNDSTVDNPILDKEYIKIVKTNLFKDNNRYDTSCYNNSEDRVPEVVVHYEVNLPDWESPVLVVDRVVDAVRDGVYVKKIYGMYNGDANYSVDIADDATINYADFVKGNIMQILTKSNGELIKYDLLFTASYMYDATKVNIAYNIANPRAITYGKVYKKTDALIGVDTSKTSASGTYDASRIWYFYNYKIGKIYVYDVLKGQTYASTANNIEVGDMVLIHDENLSVKNIVIIKWTER